jgi:DNA-directed RNA polymerase specialized sigma24 family protein
MALSREAFAALLARMDPDPERAGDRYEEARLRLIKFFQWRHAASPEDLADETIDRVSRSLEEDDALQPRNWPAFWHGFARNVLREEWKKRIDVRQPPAAPAFTTGPGRDEETREFRLACLDRCLRGLSDESRTLILQYYQLRKGAQIEHRKRLAEERGIPLNALRLRVHRIRGKLEAAMRSCLAGPQPRPTRIPDDATPERGPLHAWTVSNPIPSGCGDTSSAREPKTTVSA